MPEAVHQQHRFRTAICLQIKDENPEAVTTLPIHHLTSTIQLLSLPE
jgi:hypothetical protein